MQASLSQEQIPGVGILELELLEIPLANCAGFLWARTCVHALLRFKD